MLYSVQRDDTPDRIAAKFGHPGDAILLVRANPSRPTMINLGRLTFRNLYIGEVLQVPASWATRQLAGTVGAIGLGAVDVPTASKDLVGLDLSYPRVKVLVWQKAFNAAVAAGTYPGPQLSQEDGEYGHKSSAALQQVIDADPAITLAFGGTAPAGNSTFGAETQADLVAILGRIMSAGTTCNAAATDDVLAFQDCWNHIQGVNQLSMDGIYGTNTSKVAVTVNPAAPTCAVVPPPVAGPPLALVGAAQAVATDQNLCTSPNATVQAFMAQYAVWTGSTGLDTPTSYNADVQDAVNAVLFASGGVAAGNAPALCPVVTPDAAGGSGSAILFATLAVAAAAGGYFYLKSRHGSGSPARAAVTSPGRVRSTLGRRGHVLAMHRAR